MQSSLDDDVPFGKRRSSSAALGREGRDIIFKTAAMPCHLITLGTKRGKTKMKTFSLTFLTTKDLSILLSGQSVIRGPNSENVTLGISCSLTGIRDDNYISAHEDILMLSTYDLGLNSYRFSVSINIVVARLIAYKLAKSFSKIAKIISIFQNSNLSSCIMR